MDWIDRASYLYRRYGAEIVGKPAEVRWPSGAKFRLGHLKNRQSYEKYLGHEYQRQLVEELTLIPQEDYYIRILGSCRSTVQDEDGNLLLKPQVFCTTNPGGPGHLWVKERFIDPAPYGEIFEDEQGRKRVYIPGTIEDNPILANDESYVAYLDGLKRTDPDLHRAWRHGDWDIHAGQFFTTFRKDRHVVDHFEPVDDLPRFGGIDWGRRSPFAFLAGALQKVEYIDPDTNEDYTFNRMWMYREIYGTEKDPHEWAELIKREVEINKFRKIMADPKMHHRKDDGSRSIADQMREAGVTTQPANNDRVGGWEVVKNWLSLAPDGVPYLVISERCQNLIRTIPSLVYDENDPFDLDTEGEDHACFVAGTKVSALGGDKNIEDVKVGDLVLTRKGYKEVVFTGSREADIHKVTLSNGNEVMTTKDHPFWVEGRGFVSTDALRYNDTVCHLNTKPSTIKNTIGMVSIISQLTKRVVSVCTEMFGSITMARYPMAMKYTTLTEIQPTTTFPTLSYLLQRNTIKNTIQKKRQKNGERSLKSTQDQKQSNGTNQKKGKSFISGLVRNLGKIEKKEKLPKIVSFAIGSIRRFILVVLNTVIQIANKLLYEQDVQVKEVRPLNTTETVYNITVEGEHEYFANGILVSNCDALRYLLMHVNWIDAKVGGVKRPQKKKLPPRHRFTIDPTIFGK